MEDDKHLWDQFVKLGDMMGDGKKRREQKNGFINQQMNKLLLDKKCTCGGVLRQSRSGSKICYCENCSKRFKATTKK